jgi:hypothetical protein
LEIYCVAKMITHWNSDSLSLFKLIHYEGKLYWEWSCLENSIRFNEIHPYYFKLNRTFYSQNLFNGHRELIEFEEGDL